MTEAGAALRTQATYRNRNPGWTIVASCRGLGAAVKNGAGHYPAYVEFACRIAMTRNAAGGAFLVRMHLLPGVPVGVRYAFVRPL